MRSLAARAKGNGGQLEIGNVVFGAGDPLRIAEIIQISRKNCFRRRMGEEIVGRGAERSGRERPSWRIRTTECNDSSRSQALLRNRRE